MLCIYALICNDARFADQLRICKVKIHAWLIWSFEELSINRKSIVHTQWKVKIYASVSVHVVVAGNINFPGVESLR